MGLFGLLVCVGGLLVGLLGVLPPGLMVAFGMMFRGGSMRFCGILMMLCRFIMFVSWHLLLLSNLRRSRASRMRSTSCGCLWKQTRLSRRFDSCGVPGRRFNVYCFRF